MRIRAMMLAAVLVFFTRVASADTFDEAGTFDYICGIHPSMHGTVKVA